MININKLYISKRFTVRLSGKYVHSPLGEFFESKQEWINLVDITNSYKYISELAHSLL